MRLAILSDIHGNSLALDAVLADIEAQGGVDGYWVLGDLLALGYDPVGVLERLAQLPNASYVRGNTDRYLVSGERPSPTPEQLAQNPDLLPRVMQIAQNFAWTIGALHRTAWYDTLAALPLEQRLTLPDGTRILFVHAAPGTDDGEGIHPRLTDDALRPLFKDANADLIFVGHTHWALDKTIDNTRIINLGSLSLPFAPDLRAKYVLLTADTNGYTLEHRRVEYDLAAAITATEQTHNPAAEFITRSLQCKNRPQWSHNLTLAETERLSLPAEWADS